MSKKLHIIAFDNPYPANYGGAIDIYYKIKELYTLNIHITLHVYALKNQIAHTKVSQYCKKVYYYKRNTSMLSHFSILPYRIKSRDDKKLLSRLLSDKSPILYEGLHSCYTLPKIPQNRIYLRAHNIEHKYFYKLANTEKSLFKKAVFYLEGYKLQLFEKKIKKCVGIFSISPLEQEYFYKTYGNNAIYIPAFYDTSKNQFKKEDQKIVLYHGNLAVSENSNAALFLIDTYKKSPFKLIIASNFKNKKVLKEIKKFDNIQYVDIPTQKDLDLLFSQAQVNTLITSQNTGIKLKLLNALHKGQFVIANNLMIDKTGLESLCEIANSKEEILQKTAVLFSKNYNEVEANKRIKILNTIAPKNSAKKIVDIIFKQ